MIRAAIGHKIAQGISDLVHLAFAPESIFYDFDHLFSGEFKYTLFQRRSGWWAGFHSWLQKYEVIILHLVQRHVIPAMTLKQCDPVPFSFAMTKSSLLWLVDNLVPRTLHPHLHTFEPALANDPAPYCLQRLVWSVAEINILQEKDSYWLPASFPYVPAHVLPSMHLNLLYHHSKVNVDVIPLLLVMLYRGILSEYILRSRRS